MDPDDRETVLNKRGQNNIECSVIGKLTDKENGLEIIVDGEVRELSCFEVDELTSVI